MKEEIHEYQGSKHLGDLIFRQTVILLAMSHQIFSSSLFCRKLDHLTLAQVSY